MRRLVLCVLASVAASGCAYDGYGYGPHGGANYGDFAYEGRDWAGPRPDSGGPLRGPGVEVLDPWLLETREGQEIVRLGFQAAAEGYIDEPTADRANSWFRRYADTDRDMRLTDPEIRVALVQAGRARF